MKLVLCSIVEVFDFRTFDYVRFPNPIELNRAMEFDWVRLPNVRLTKPRVNVQQRYRWCLQLFNLQTRGFLSKKREVILALEMFIVNPSPNHLTTTPLAAQEQYFKHYLIMMYYHSQTNNITKGRFPNFTAKLNILKSKLRPKLLI